MKRTGLAPARLALPTAGGAQRSEPAAERALPGSQAHPLTQWIAPSEAADQPVSPAQDDGRVHGQTAVADEAAKRCRLCEKLLHPVEHTVQYRSRLPFRRRRPQVLRRDHRIVEELAGDAQPVEVDRGIFAIAQLPQNVQPAAECIRRAAAPLDVFAHELQRVSSDRGGSELAVDHQVVPAGAHVAAGVAAQRLQDVPGVLNGNPCLLKASVKIARDGIRLLGPQPPAAASECRLQSRQTRQLLVTAERTVIRNGFCQTNEPAEGSQMRAQRLGEQLRHQRKVGVAA